VGGFGRFGLLDSLYDLAFDLAGDCSIFAFRRFLFLGGLRVGMVKLKVEPMPGSLFTQIRPPCISIRDLRWADPDPYPRIGGGGTFRLLERLEDAVELVQGDAMPESVTETWTIVRPSSTMRKDDTVTLPCAVNFAALETRFSRIWRERNSSPHTLGRPVRPPCADGSACP